MTTFERLITAAKECSPMTPTEVREQKISFVYGQLMDAQPNITKEEIAAELYRMEGQTDVNE